MDAELDGNMLKAIDQFSLEKHEGPYEKWGLRSELMSDGKATGFSLPGYIMEGQYKFDDGYLFVTSWDCVYEDAIDITSTNSALDIRHHHKIGVPYHTLLIHSLEITDRHSLLLKTNGDDFRNDVYPEFLITPLDAASAYSLDWNSRQNISVTPQERRRFWLIFSVILTIGIVLNVLPYFLTKGTYQADGQQVAGFPWTFHKIGGDCYPSACDNYTSLSKLLADLILWIGGATLIAWLFNRRKCQSQL